VLQGARKPDLFERANYSLHKTETFMSFKCHEQKQEGCPMIKYLVTPLLVAASLPVAAAATPVDNYAAKPIVAAKYDVAMARLERVVREDALDETALLNLALVYRHKGRTADAAKLYRRVLAHDDALLDTVDGPPRWAHDVARAGMSHIVTFASR
jgi:tetratricopeptide (TPR) repeat protein